MEMHDTRVLYLVAGVSNVTWQSTLTADIWTVLGSDACMHCASKCEKEHVPSRLALIFPRNNRNVPLQIRDIRETMDKHQF